jgi:KipI family sensor histidine kinase inhibitor
MYVRPRFLVAGDSALVIEFGDKVSPEINAKVRRLSKFLEASLVDGVTEVVPTYRSLLVHYDPCMSSLKELRSRLRKAIRESEKVSLDGSRRVIMPVRYGGEFGPDIGDVATYNKISVEDVIHIHSNTDYVVYMIGFIVGFPYLGELPKSIACPRLKTPRVKVPAGSVGIAGTLTGIYPVEAPGGWRLIGRTPLKLFDERSDPPSLLQAGDSVQFQSVTQSEYGEIAKKIQAGTYRLETSRFE